MRSVVAALVRQCLQRQTFAASSRVPGGCIVRCIEYDDRVSPITDDQAAALIASLRSDGDRFRERARAVATLLATAAGALTAGLVFSSVGQSLPWQMKVSAGLGIVLLSISVCFFLSASLYHLREGGAPTATPAPAASPKETVYGWLDSAKAANRALTKEISKRTDRGKWVGMAGLALLIVLLPLGIWLPAERLHVGLQITAQNAQVLQDCPLIQYYVEGEIAKDDLSGSSALVPLKVSDDRCGAHGQSGDRTLYFVRSQVVIVVLGTS